MREHLIWDGSGGLAAVRATRRFPGGATRRPDFAGQEGPLRPLPTWVAEQTFGLSDAYFTHLGHTGMAKYKVGDIINHPIENTMYRKTETGWVKMSSTPYHGMEGPLERPTFGQRGPETIEEHNFTRSNPQLGKTPFVRETPLVREEAGAHLLDRWAESLQAQLTITRAKRQQLLSLHKLSEANEQTVRAIQLHGLLKWLGKEPKR